MSRKSSFTYRILSSAICITTFVQQVGISQPSLAMTENTPPPPTRGMFEKLLGKDDNAKPKANTAAATATGATKPTAVPNESGVTSAQPTQLVQKGPQPSIAPLPQVLPSVANLGAAPKPSSLSLPALKALPNETAARFDQASPNPTLNTLRPWTFNTGLVGVNTDSGAFNYAYGIAVPPMQDGLQPFVALKYSSAAAMAGLGSTQGMGWEWAMPKIGRRVVVNTQVDAEGHINQKATGYSNEFVLNLGGRDYALVPAKKPSNADEAYASAEFLTDPYTPLRVRRCAATSNLGCDEAGLAVAGSNASGEWWQVQDSNGTRYIFGRSADSEQLLMADYNPSTATPATHVGNKAGWIAQAWYLDRVYALERDDPNAAVEQGLWSAQYRYHKVSARAGSSDVALVPSEIIYGSSRRADNGIAPLNERYRVQFEYVKGRPNAPEQWQANRVRVSASKYELRQYEIGYSADTWQPNRFTEKAATSGAVMPSVSLIYADIGTGNALLAQIDNGFGGREVIHYAPIKLNQETKANARVEEVNTYAQSAKGE